MRRQRVLSNNDISDDLRESVFTEFTEFRAEMTSCRFQCWNCPRKWFSALFRFRQRSSYGYRPRPTAVTVIWFRIILFIIGLWCVLTNSAALSIKFTFISTLVKYLSFHKIKLNSWRWRGVVCTARTQREVTFPGEQYSLSSFNC